MTALMQIDPASGKFKPISPDPFNLGIPIVRTAIALPFFRSLNDSVGIGDFQEMTFPGFGPCPSCSRSLRRQFRIRKSFCTLFHAHTAWGTGVQCCIPFISPLGSLIAV